MAYGVPDCHRILHLILNKPLGVGKRLNELETYCIFVFHQTLVVPAQAHQEQYTRHILETVNPLPPLALLATNVHHHHFMFS